MGLLECVRTNVIRGRVVPIHAKRVTRVQKVSVLQGYFARACGDSMRGGNIDILLARSEASLGSVGGGLR